MNKQKMSLTVVLLVLVVGFPFHSSAQEIAEKDRVSIAVDFPWMKKGRYNLIVQVTDIQTGKTSSDFLQPVIR